MLLLLPLLILDFNLLVICCKNIILLRKKEESKKERKKEREGHKLRSNKNIEQMKVLTESERKKFLGTARQKRTTCDR